MTVFLPTFFVIPLVFEIYSHPLQNGQTLFACSFSIIVVGFFLHYDNIQRPLIESFKISITQIIKETVVKTSW